MSQRPQPDDYGSAIRDLQRQIDELGRKTNSNFIVTDPITGVKTMRVGEDASGRAIFELWRADGTILFNTSYIGANMVFRFWDRSGNIIIADDAISGKGLALPWVSVPGSAVVYPTAFLDTESTDLTLPVSAAIGNAVWTGRIGKLSHPKIQLDGVWGRVSGTTATPTYTFYVNGVLQDTWVQTTYAEAVRGPFDISSLIGFTNVSVEVKASSTGTATDRIAATVYGVWMRQT